MCRSDGKIHWGVGLSCGLGGEHQEASLNWEPGGIEILNFEGGGSMMQCACQIHVDMRSSLIGSCFPLHPLCDQTLRLLSILLGSGNVQILYRHACGDGGAESCGQPQASLPRGGRVSAPVATYDPGAPLRFYDVNGSESLHCSYPV